MATCKPNQKIFHIAIDDETGKVETETYIVRSIRKGIVHATLKCDGVTWVKQSKKTGDWGWATSIARWYRNSWEQGGALPSCMGTTKGAAIRSAIKKAEREIAGMRDNNYFDAEDIEPYERALNTLRRMAKQFR